MKIRFFLLLSIFLFVSCTTIPDLDRRSFNLLGSSQNSMGASAFNEYKRKHRISQNSAYNSQLQRVARRLTSVINLPNANWEFVVFEDSEPNAFALPGGKVGVNSGIFQITKNEAGLAAVVGHEIGHVVANHGGERASFGMGAALLDAALMAKGVPSGTRSILQGGASLGVIKPFGRKQELEADKLGTLYIARAGYNPHEAIKFWERFASYKRAKGSSQIEFLSTHPVDSTRISRLREFMPRAMQEYRSKGGVGNSRGVYRAKRFGQ